ncbi:MAG: hypothetical protein IMZ57_11145 [Acidobacteria bacterium]|nr:hypothetical protein [Acidobacteriota bacterium]
MEMLDDGEDFLAPIIIEDQSILAREATDKNVSTLARELFDREPQTMLMTDRFVFGADLVPSPDELPPAL